MYTKLCHLEIMFFIGTESYLHIDIYNTGYKLIVKKQNDFIEFNTEDELKLYVDELIDSNLCPIYYDDTIINDSIRFTIYKNNNKFLSRVMHTDYNLLYQNVYCTIIFYYNKYINIYTKICADKNKKIFELLFNKNDINNKLPTELIIKIVDNII